MKLVSIVRGASVAVLSFLAGAPVYAQAQNESQAQSPGYQAPTSPGGIPNFPGFGSRPFAAVPGYNPQSAPVAAGQDPQHESGGAPADQIPLSNIQPLDNQAISAGLAAASQQAGPEADAGRRAAFNAALAAMFPLRPDEIAALIGKMHESQAAIAGPSIGNPKAEVKAETIPLEPGAQPPLIETDTGFVTTVSMLDSTGNPWPILDMGVGGNFDIPAPEEGGNVLRITPLAKYASGNLSIRLVGLTTPISFRLKATTGTVDYRYDARIPKLGPKAAVPLIDHGNDLVAGDGLLMDVLDGNPPLSSARLSVIGVDQRTAAWRIGDRVYVRTPFTLISPGWEGSVGSGDGTRVYQIPDTPVLLLSDNGNLVHARIGNNAKTDEQPVPAIQDGMAHPLRASALSGPDSASGVPSGGDNIIPTPAGSRTLIRPVKSQSTLANQNSAAAGSAGGQSSTSAQSQNSQSQ